MSDVGKTQITEATGVCDILRKGIIFYHKGEDGCIVAVKNEKVYRILRGIQDEGDGPKSRIVGE